MRLSLVRLTLLSTIWSGRCCLQEVFVPTNDQTQLGSPGCEWSRRSAQRSVKQRLDSAVLHQLFWDNPLRRHWSEALAERRVLVRYDPRGLGLSARDVTDQWLRAFACATFQHRLAWGCGPISTLASMDRRHRWAPAPPL